MSVDQSTKVLETLKQLGIKVCLEVVEGKDHGFDTGFEDDVDVEADGSETDSVLTQLKRIVAFLDTAANP